MRDDPRQPLAARRRRLIGCFLVFGITAVVGASLRADDWPEWRGKGRLGVWNETGIIERIPAGGLPVAWRMPVNEGYAGPSVSGGRVFVTDARAVKANQKIERILALDEATGRVLWSQEWQTDYSGLQLVYAIGPRATPTVDGDRVYVVGAMGNLLALDAASGRTLWKKDYAKDFDASVPSWGFASAPLVDGDRLICIVGGEPDAKVVAFDKMTGDVIWKSMSSETEPGYNQPIIFEEGGVRQLIIFHPMGFASLDPATGKLYWEIEHRSQMGIVVATPIKNGRHLFFTSQYGGARMLTLDPSKPAAKVHLAGPGRAGSGIHARYARHAELGHQHARHGRRLRVRHRQRRPASMSYR